MNHRLIVLLFSAVVSFPLYCSEADLIFQSIEPLDITLTAAFDRIDDERDKEARYDGVLTYIDAQGASVNLDVEFEVRGNYRLRKSNCRYSQLWVDLKRGQLEGTLFENQNRLKLVVQCRRQNRYSDYIVREQQAYTMFSELTEYNFDTRMLNVTYIDSEDDGSSRTHIAFFIEHQNRMAERFQMDKVELNGIPRAELNAHQGVLVSIFMFLIGNTDYSIIRGPEGDECCHNSKLLLDNGGEYFPIPYDFDASGFIDATYAPDPNPDFGIRNNRQRVYRGFCVSDEAMAAAIETYKAAQQNIAAIVADETYVSPRSARRSANYVEDFFKIINDPRKLQREIIRDCRG